MITVTVPVYNMENYLGRSIPALLGQTYRNYEIILVDDGSTDKSPEICDRFARENTNVRVFHQENGGPSRARNCGLEHAHGEYVAFADPDDWVAPDFLETLVRIHEKHGADLEICGHYVVQDGNESTWNENARESVIDGKSALRLLMRRDSFCGYPWNKLFHMDIIREHGLRFDEDLGSMQDLHMCYRYISHCRSVAYDPKPVYYYDPGIGVSSPATPVTERKISGLAAYEKIAALAGEKNPDIVTAAYSSLFNFSMSYIYTYYYTGMKEPEKLETLKRNLQKYKPWFFRDEGHSAKHKLLGRVALASPGAYYLCSRIIRHMSGRE